jgi:hypothetical protein
MTNKSGDPNEYAFPNVKSGNIWNFTI